MTGWLTYKELDAMAEEYDAAVGSGFALDRFCSSTFWILPAARHLSPEAAPRIASVNGTFSVLARSGAWLHPLEAMWGLACPLVAPDADAAIELFCRALEKERGWSSCLATGLEEGSPSWAALRRALSRRYHFERGPTTRRYVARLDDGLEGFLSRRPAGLRRSLPKALRRSSREGLAFEVPDRRDPAFERLLAVERRSWKGLQGIGIDREPMRSFYRDMNLRLLQRGQRRLMFARLDGEDVAYIFGGVLGDTYRGLQFSFDARFSSLSLGNLCQLEEVRRLSESGVRRYDLGSEVRYKQKWGEEVVQTTALIITRI
ncbi:MAG TPA: GNAT family N-acetyltransferase [Vicinamibacteria bacterium]|nr:GNAT family N-acetyltransferase [Vicinamibacteria bacterium]